MITITRNIICTHAGAPREYDPHDVLPNEPIRLYFSEPNSHGHFTISGTQNIGTDTSFLIGSYELLWVHNGTRLNILDGSHYRASLTLEPEELHLSLEILNFTDSDAGLYIGVVNTRPSDLFRYFGCDSLGSIRQVQIPIGLVPISLQNIG